MMAASRRDRDSPSLTVRLPGSVLPDRPPISALFLIDFDVKAGYTIVWKQAIPGLELEGTVEYKSLPSGLHTVQEDLIYFVHEDGYAGLSAFINTRTDEEETRHARMIAVGVLVPLSYGRLGRAWRHAEGLIEMTRKLAEDRKQTQILEKYWVQNNGSANDGKSRPDINASPLGSPTVSFQSFRPTAGKGHSRMRSASDGAALMPPGHRLSPYHPAWSLTRLLDTFGPLIFPIHRAALLRKRILISTHAPVHETCNFVYDISIISNIPLSVFDILDPSAPAQRLRPLFTIGVHDIPFLIENHEASKRANSTGRDDAIEEDETGWVACTTDSILAIKEELWDVLITMPPNFSVNAKEKVWPTVESPKGRPVKATQRDLRRFHSLQAGLARLSDPSARAPPSPARSDGPGPPPHHLTSAPSGPTRPSTSSGRSFFSLVEAGAPPMRPLLADGAEMLVEPVTWAALAYSGFLWWASAGEQRRAEETDEHARDAALLADLAAPTMGAGPPPRSASAMGVAGLGDSVASLALGRRAVVSSGNDVPGQPQPQPQPVAASDDADDRARAELAIIAYFHRLTTQMLAVLADLVDSCVDDSDDDGSGRGSGEGSEEGALLDDESAGRGGGRGVRVDGEALERMGLDVWSAGDADFVRDATARYFARRAVVEGKGVDVCGMRIC